MTEWHVFTKDGNEYTGKNLHIKVGCVILYRMHYWKVTRTVRDWKKLWLQFKDIKWQEEEQTDDYIIPISQVLRVERWDVGKKGDSK